MRRLMVAGIVLVGMGFCGAALAQCGPGEVWGDVGCRPKPSPSLLTRAVREYRENRLRKKKLRWMVRKMDQR
jgi:hypothetical protein